MADMRIEINYEAVGEQLLKSDETMALCKSYADEIARRCGKGYEVNTYVGRNRVNASVIATTQEAIQENSENNTILKAIK